MYQKVYRVEHKKNLNKRLSKSGIKVYNGCYRDYNNKLIDLGKENVCNKMRNVPLPWFWDNSGRDKNAIFAFTSLEVMNKYFDSEVHETLKELGCIIGVYKVPISDIIFDEAGIQCAFYPKNAKKIVRRTYKNEQTFKQLKAA